MSIILQDKFFGCICGCHIGSAMGAPVEGMTYEEIDRKYGYVDGYLPYQHYGNGWDREPGTTEDGVERQKLMISAIMEKEGRVTAEDVRAAWNKYANPNAGGWVSEPFEGVLLKMAKTGIPATDLGRYCDYAGLNSFARACHPIGLINAGNVEGAKEDILQVGQLYQTTNSRGLKWACVTGVAIAEGMPYPFSYANEVVTKGVVIFKMVHGNTKEAILAGVNMGRDTDCVAAVAGGIAGALSGSESIPADWISQLDYATSINPHTNSKRTLKENADGVYHAFKKMLKRQQAYIQQMDID